MKDINIGFLDVLTGFLCVSVFLLIMIRPGQKPDQDFVGNPREFLWYQVKLSSRLPSDSIKLDSVKITAIVKINNEIKQMAINADNGEYALMNDDIFITMKNDNAKDLYAWGPQYSISENGRINFNQIVFNIYGVSRREGEINVGILFSDYKGIENRSNLKETVKSSVNIEHNLRTLTLTDHTYNSADRHLVYRSDTISLGEYSFLYPPS